MNNFKETAFLGIRSSFIYWIIGALFALVIGPYIILEKILFGVVVLLALGVLAVSARFPFPDKSYWKYFPLVFGVFAACGGFLVIYSTLELLSIGGYRDPWNAFVGINGAAMLPVGFLMILFSAINLVLERKKTAGATSQNGPSK